VDRYVIFGNPWRNLFEFFHKRFHAVGAGAASDQHRVLAGHHHKVIDPEQRHDGLVAVHVRASGVDENGRSVLGILRRVLG
jgi:hypothetical protein